MNKELKSFNPFFQVFFLNQSEIYGSMAAVAKSFNPFFQVFFLN